MPRTVAGVKALAAKLKKKKSTADLGNYYLTLIATPEQRQQLSLYRFQAFDWPASLSQPVPVEVSVGAVRRQERDHGEAPPVDRGGVRQRARSPTRARR